MSWTQLYFSPWHVSFFSSPYMTLIKPCNLKCIWIGLVGPFNSSGEKDDVVQNPIKQSGRSCIWWSPGGHIIGSKWGNKNRTENCSQCAGKDSKKKQQSCLFVWTRHVNWTMEWRSTGKQRPLFAETDFIQHCLLSAGLARVCFWLVPREGAGQVLGFCDNHEDCNNLCFVIRRSHMATEGGFQVSFSII